MSLYIDCGCAAEGRQNARSPWLVVLNRELSRAEQQTGMIDVGFIRLNLVPYRSVRPPSLERFPNCRPLLAKDLASSQLQLFGIAAQRIGLRQ